MLRKNKLVVGGVTLSADLEGVEDEDDEAGDEVLDRVAEGESCLTTTPIKGKPASVWLESKRLQRSFCLTRFVCV